MPLQTLSRSGKEHFLGNFRQGCESRASTKVEHLFVLMDANIRTERKGGEEVGNAVSSAPIVEMHSTTTVSNHYSSLPTINLLL